MSAFKINKECAQLLGQQVLLQNWAVIHSLSQCSLIDKCLLWLKTILLYISICYSLNSVHCLYLAPNFQL